VTESDAVADGLDATAPRLALAVGRLNRRLLRATSGLSHGTVSALSSIVRFGPLRLSELAQHEGIAAPSITRIVADLEARGLVGREVDASDRRAFAIEATPSGVDYIVRARSARAELVAELLGALDAEQLAAVEAALPALEAMALRGLDSPLRDAPLR
jgi:DNA-binding MarR family transcriptional regulator